MEEKDLLVVVAAGQGMESKGQVLEEVVIPLPRPRSRKCGEWPTPSRRPCGTSQAKDKGGCWRRHATQTNQDATPRPRPRIASFIAPLPRRPKNPEYHDQAGYLRRQLAKAKKAANLAQGDAKKQANLANKKDNQVHALVLQLATQEKKVEEQEKKAEEQEKKAKQAQVGAQAQVAAAMAAISQGLLQRVQSAGVLRTAMKGALARRTVRECKEQEKKAEEARLHAAEALQAAIAGYVARRALAECRLGAVDAHVREVCSEFVTSLSEELQNVISHELVWWHWGSLRGLSGEKRFEWKLKFRGEVDEAHHEEDRKWAVSYRKVSLGAKRISPAQWYAVTGAWEDALLDFSDQVHAIIPYKLVWWEMDQNFDVELDGLSPAGVPMWIWRLEFQGICI